VAFSVGLAGFVGLEDQIPARIAEWHKMVCSRPAFQRASER
jgi:hypothetical protein